jgi:hypothetical protein
VSIVYHGPIKAPIAKGQHDCRSGGEPIDGRLHQVMPLVAGDAVSEAGFFGRAWEWLEVILRVNVTSAHSSLWKAGRASANRRRSRLLAEALRARGQKVVTTREPGGTEGAEAIRGLLLTGSVDRWNARPRRCCSRRPAPIMSPS